jgi:hypothetical protein
MPPSRKPAAPSLSAVVAMMDHPRASTTWIARAIIGKNGQPEIERLTRIVWIPPRDGAGRLRVCVTDWNQRDAHGDPSHYIAAASGFGYDKLTAALDGCTIGGFKVGDHCNGDGLPTPRELVQREGWAVFGDYFPG